MNAAVTTVFACSNTLHVVAELVSQPPHVTAVAGLVGAAVSVTVVPVVNCAAQIVPQSIPAGELVTVPVPVTLTLRLLVEPPCGQPRLAGPSTVMFEVLEITRLPPSSKVAVMFAIPQAVFGLTTPADVT